MFSCFRLARRPIETDVVKKERDGVVSERQDGKSRVGDPVRAGTRIVDEVRGRLAASDEESVTTRSRS